MCFSPNTIILLSFHNTTVAGTIGAVGNNGVGMAGLNWNVKLMSIKFLDDTGRGSTLDALRGFDKLLELKNAGVNLRVTNNSWGGGGREMALQDAMHALEVAGVVNVCAAGNSGGNSDINPFFPAAYPNRGIISVLATGQNDASAAFTTYGVGKTRN